MSREHQEVAFASRGVTLRASLFRPASSPLSNARGVPCVVLAHGLGGTRDTRLEPFARCFADAGLAALYIRLSRLWHERQHAAAGGERAQAVGRLRRGHRLCARSFRHRSCASLPGAAPSTASPMARFRCEASNCPS